MSKSISVLYKVKDLLNQASLYSLYRSLFSQLLRGTLIVERNTRVELPILELLKQ